MSPFYSTNNRRNITPLRQTNTVSYSLIQFTIEANAQFGGYYSTISGQSGTVLKNALNSIIDNHNSLSYTPGVWDAHKDLY